MATISQFAKLQDKTRPPSGHPKTMSRKFREPFDRDRNYVLNKSFKFNGKSLVVGSVFDKTTTTTRRLRQLYESRYLNMSPVGTPNVLGGPVMPNFPLMKEDELRAWLAAHGREQKEVARHDVMVARAIRIWYELQDKAKEDKKAAEEVKSPEESIAPEEAPVPAHEDIVPPVLDPSEAPLQQDVVVASVELPVTQPAPVVDEPKPVPAKRVRIRKGK